MDWDRRDVLIGGGAALGTIGLGNMAAAAPTRAFELNQDAWMYTDRLSYLPGERAQFHVSMPGRTATLRLTRIGGKNTVVFEKAGFPLARQAVPARASENGCGWTPTFELPITDWPSGYYRAQLITASRIAEHCFVVRSANPGRDASIVMPLSFNTMHAYNWWGGKNLYEDVEPDDIRAPGQQGQSERTAARFLSTQRPFALGVLLGHPARPRFPNKRHRKFEEQPFYEGVRYVLEPGYSRWDFAAGFQDKWEHTLLEWLERAGHRVDLIDQADMGREPEILDPYRLYVTAGHNEYMSWEERDEVERFTQSGGNALMLSGNHAFWQVRWEQDHTRMVCYKSSVADDPVWQSADKSHATTYWSAPEVGRPETQMTGLTFARGGFANLGLATSRGIGGYVIYDDKHWALAGSDLFYGDTLGIADRIVGWEVDGCAFTFVDGRPVPTGECGAPTDMTIIGIAPATFERTDTAYDPAALLMGGGYGRLAASLYGEETPETVAKVLRGHVTLAAWKDGAEGGEIFNAGSCDWVYGLSGKDPFVVKITENVLERLA